MECAQARERLLDCREGQLDLEGQMRLEAHLVLCNRCLEEYERLELLLSSVAALPVPDPSPEFARRLHARIAEEKQPPTSAWRPRPQMARAWAGASLALMLLIGQAVWTLSSHPVSSSVRKGNEPLQGAVWNPLRDEEVRVRLNLWPNDDPDLTALTDKVDGGLGSLALRGKNYSVEEVAALWAWGYRPQKMMSLLVGISAELSDPELQQLLVRLRG